MVSVILPYAFYMDFDNREEIEDLLVAVFLCWDSRNRLLWRGIIVLYSNLGFIAFGLSNDPYDLQFGFAWLMLGMIGETAAT
jgi:hypothetical protein